MWIQIFWKSNQNLKPQCMLSVQFTINDVTKSRILYFTKCPLNLNLPAEVHVWSWYGATMLWTSGTCRDGQSVIGWKVVTWSKHTQVIGHCITHSWIPRGQLFCWVILGALKYSRSPKSSKLMKTAFSSTYLGYGTWLAHQSFFFVLIGCLGSRDKMADPWWGKLEKYPSRDANTELWLVSFCQCHVVLMFINALTTSKGKNIHRFVH